MTDWQLLAPSARATTGRVQAVAAGGPGWRCALGRSGRRALKFEGDGATPTPPGGFVLIGGYYRADRLPRPSSPLPFQPIARHDAWCDNPADRNYNRPVTLPYPDITERLWRADHLYDIILVPDYNLRPRIRHKGSAIFMHLARPGYQPTEGCIAFSLADMLHFLRHYRLGDRLITGGTPAI